MRRSSQQSTTAPLGSGSEAVDKLSVQLCEPEAPHYRVDVAPFSAWHRGQGSSILQAKQARLQNSTREHSRNSRRSKVLRQSKRRFRCSLVQRRWD